MSGCEAVSYFNQFAAPVKAKSGKADALACRLSLDAWEAAELDGTLVFNLEVHGDDCGETVVPGVAGFAIGGSYPKKIG